MNLDTKTVIIIIVICFIIWKCVLNKEGFNLEGNQLTWDQLPREEHICDTGYNDEDCTMTSANCSFEPWI